MTLLHCVDPRVPPEQRTISRAILERRLIESGQKPDAFWSDFSGVAAPLFAARDTKSRQATANEAGTEADPASHLRGCRARAAALEAARDKFGRPAFDQLLYTVVAPTMSVHGPVSDTEAVGLKYLAGGCK